MSCRQLRGGQNHKLGCETRMWNKYVKKGDRIRHFGIFIQRQVLEGYHVKIKCLGKTGLCANKYKVKWIDADTVI